MKTYKVKVVVSGDGMDDFIRENDLIPSSCSSLIDFFQFLALVSEEAVKSKKI